jgi:hypothetical protein
LDRRPRDAARSLGSRAIVVAVPGRWPLGDLASVFAEQKIDEPADGEDITLDIGLGVVPPLGLGERLDRFLASTPESPGPGAFPSPSLGA